MVEATLTPVDHGDFLTEYISDSNQSSFRAYPKFDGDRFENPWDTWSHPSFYRGLRFLCSRAVSKFRRPLPSTDDNTSLLGLSLGLCIDCLPSSEVLEAELPIKTPLFVSEGSQPPLPNAPLQITWIGHASTVVCMDGLTIITDPIFSNYCSPLPMGSLRRFRPPPCTIDQLPGGAVLVLISHNHYDHLDYKSVVDLHRRYGDQVTFCVPKGLADWFRSNIPGLRVYGVVEMTWWQCANFHFKKGDGSCEPEQLFQVVCTPAQHWSMRRPLSRNKSLWSGWAVIGPSGRRFYFAGDTGYCTAFKEIGAELGPFDLAAIPIGAYVPRELLGPQHVNPQEAVEIHLDIKSKKSVGIHWGTFRLGGEKTLAPRPDLVSAVADSKLDSNAFVTIAHGETLVLSSNSEKMCMS